MAFPSRVKAAALVLLMLATPVSQTFAADEALLKVLLENGVITQAQYDQLSTKDKLTSEDLLPSERTAASTPQTPDTPQISEQTVAQMVDSKIQERLPLNVDHGSKGFKFETLDGKFQTNLQWRAQMRYTSPLSSDPRQASNFRRDDTPGFEPRRLRMKIGGHGFQPWLKYYFEVDLQPARDVDDSSSSSSARVIDWRVDIAKWDWGGIRLGQWKIDLNRERVDSSGRQQFVERSIVNRVFTMDRQIGAQLRGRAFKGTPADIQYWVGIFNGEGRSVKNNSDDHMVMGRVQWNLFGRELAWRQTDVEYTELPTASLAFAGFRNTGPCTRWSSSGCGNLDGFTRAAQAQSDQFEIEQYVQEFAFKYRGFSFQQEWHRKFIDDRVLDRSDDLTGFYAQAGYFPHHIFQGFPAPLELAVRYGYVEEPNATDRDFLNEREEFTLGANWFFSGHNNKITLDFSKLTLDDDLLSRDFSENRVRLQWDVSF